MSGAAEATVGILEGLGLGVHRRAETSSARVDLDALRVQGVADADGYVATLGKNARQQIRRSMRLYAERGPLRLDACTDVEAFLCRSRRASRSQVARGRGFGRDGQCRLHGLHRRMIADALPRGEVELLRASAGGEGFGWLYNFVSGGQVLFYLSGFRAERTTD